jgi:cytochrome b561
MPGSCCPTTASRSPALPPETGLLSRRLSSAAHLLLYLLVFVIPLVGIVTFVWHGLIGIHLLTALWHQFVWHDRLLQRMWPAARSDT